MLKHSPKSRPPTTVPPRKNFYRSDPFEHGDEIAETANDAFRSRQAQTRSRRTVMGCRFCPGPQPPPARSARGSQQCLSSGKLEQNDIVEQLEEPTKDPNLNLMRVKVKARRTKQKDMGNSFSSAVVEYGR